MITHFFSDLDDILAHMVRPSNAQNAIEVGNGFYITKPNLDALTELQNSGVRLGIVTTRRYSTAQVAFNAIPHRYAVADHGTIILIDGQPDREWLEALKPYIGNPLTREKQGLLWDYEQEVRTELARQGFEVYSDDRFGSFRVVPPPPFTTLELQQLVQIIKPEGIDAIIVRGFVDFFPSMAGKANSVRYILGKEEATNFNNVAYAGDDVSDVAALVQFYPITTKDAGLGALEVVLARGGYVSQLAAHEATADIIAHVEAMSKQDMRP